MALDACFLTYLTREIHAATDGARVEKIYQPGKDEIILIQFDCGDLACDDFAENTIFHFFFFSCFWGIFTFLTVIFFVVFG